MEHTRWGFHHMMRAEQERYKKEHPEVNWRIHEILFARDKETDTWVAVRHKRRDVVLDELVSRRCGHEDRLRGWQIAIRRMKIQLGLLRPHWTFCLTWWCLMPVRRAVCPQVRDRCYWHRRD